MYSIVAYKCFLLPVCNRFSNYYSCSGYRSICSISSHGREGGSNSNITHERVEVVVVAVTGTVVVVGQ